MKIVASLLLVVAAARSAGAFTAAPNTSRPTASASSATTTARSMGLFDFFSDEAREERERLRREREDEKERMIEEQMKYQREIIARRTDPEKVRPVPSVRATRRVARLPPSMLRRDFAILRFSRRNDYLSGSRRGRRDDRRDSRARPRKRMRSRWRSTRRRCARDVSCG